MSSFLPLGSLNAALAVILGAFGAHALRARLTPEMTEVYRTASQYHLAHAIGLVVVGLVAASPSFATSAAVRASGWLMLAGIVLFSGSLYLLSITGTRWLGAITPLGGLCFIAAWGALAAGTLRRG